MAHQIPAKAQKKITAIEHRKAMHDSLITFLLRHPRGGWPTSA